MVIWSQSAKADLRAIHDYIAEGSRHYAKKVVQDIREKAEGLRELPKSGKKLPELDDEDVREFSLYSYRIIYEINAQDIFVLAIVHKRKDLKAEDITLKPPT
jgi:plasmid stabilization system protein ParE